MRFSYRHRVTNVSYTKHEKAANNVKSKEHSALPFIRGSCVDDSFETAGLCLPQLHVCDGYFSSSLLPALITIHDECRCVAEMELNCFPFTASVTPVTTELLRLPLPIGGRKWTQRISCSRYVCT